MLDATPGLGLGRVAGRGRKRKAPSTVANVPMGTSTVLATNTATALMARCMAEKQLITCWADPGSRPLPRARSYCHDVRPPSVDALARQLADVGLPHPLLVEAAREAIA